MSTDQPASPAVQKSSLLRKLAPGLVLGFLVLVALSLIGDLAQVGLLLARFNWWMFPLALCFTAFNYTLRFVKWHF
jgi:fatty acid desaturase